MGRGAVFGGLGSQRAGGDLMLGGGVTHCRTELSMIAVTRVLIGVLLLGGAGCPGEGLARDSGARARLREGLVKCAEARWEQAVVERDRPRPDILAPGPVTGDLERDNSILSKI